MRVKLFSIILLFFIALSNISFSLTSIYSFCIVKDNFSTYNTITIQEQYNMLIGIPKDFLDLCVKIQDDFKLFKTNQEVNLFFNKDINVFNNNVLAILTNPLKLKKSYFYTKAIFIEKVNEYSNNIFMFISIILIFYILRYVGLLKLFSSYNYINKKSKGFYYSV